MKQQQNVNRLTRRRSHTSVTQLCQMRYTHDARTIQAPDLFMYVCMRRSVRIEPLKRLVADRSPDSLPQ